MTDHGPGGSEAQPHAPSDLEQTVDELEDRVLGHQVDQVRHEDDDPDKPAFEQDLDTADPDAEPGSGAGAEPSS